MGNIESSLLGNQPQGSILNRGYLSKLISSTIESLPDVLIDLIVDYYSLTDSYNAIAFIPNDFGNDLKIFSASGQTIWSSKTKIEGITYSKLIQSSYFTTSIPILYPEKIKKFPFPNYILIANSLKLAIYPVQSNSIPCILTHNTNSKSNGQIYAAELLERVVINQNKAYDKLIICCAVTDEIGFIHLEYELKDPNNKRSFTFSIQHYHSEKVNLTAENSRDYRRVIYPMKLWDFNNSRYKYFVLIFTNLKHVILTQKQASSLSAALPSNWSMHSYTELEGIDRLRSTGRIVAHCSWNCSDKRTTNAFELFAVWRNDCVTVNVASLFNEEKGIEFQPLIDLKYTRGEVQSVCVTNIHTKNPNTNGCIVFQVVILRPNDAQIYWIELQCTEIERAIQKYFKEISKESTVNSKHCTNRLRSFEWSEYNAWTTQVPNVQVLVNTTRFFSEAVNCSVILIGNCSLRPVQHPDILAEWSNFQLYSACELEGKQHEENPTFEINLFGYYQSRKGEFCYGWLTLKSIYNRFKPLTKQLINPHTELETAYRIMLETKFHFGPQFHPLTL